MEMRIVQRDGIHWGAAAQAGIAGGALFLALEFLLVPLFLGGSAWGPLRMIAAIVLGRDVLPPPATFDGGIMSTAVLVHFMLSALFGIILAVALRRSSSELGILGGAVFGLALYFVNFYVMTAVFPWFVAGRNWVSVFSHIAFGIGTAWWYFAMASRRPGARAP
jgi:hypothetical protein